MRYLVLIISTIFLLSCRSFNSRDSQEFSWYSLKDSFALQNIEEFRIDSNIWNNYRTLHLIKNKIIDSAIQSGDSNPQTYLYSWQDRNSSFIEFTSLLVEEYLGFTLIYFVFSKDGKLISAIRIARLSGEDGIIWEKKSRFISKDTFTTIASVSTELDRNSPQPYKKLSKSIGDSSFLKLVFKKNGTLDTISSVRKIELNYH
jgi:hypothetical protein